MMGEKRKRSYYSDATRNYLVLECPPELKDNYQYRMLAANRIKGLLDCSGRTIDGREYLYYDITSRQSLADVFDRRPVRGADLERILESLFRVEERLTEYLLDTSHLIPEPDCIFMDFRGQECSFVYYPGDLQEQARKEPRSPEAADRPTAGRLTADRSTADILTACADTAQAKAQAEALLCSSETAEKTVKRTAKSQWADPAQQTVPGLVRSEGWGPLFTFLADRVDGRDKQAAALIYRLCMMAERPGFQLRADLLDDLGIHIGVNSDDHRQTFRDSWNASGREPYPDRTGRAGFDRYPGAGKMNDLSQYPGAEKMDEFSRYPGAGKMDDFSQRPRTGKMEAFSWSPGAEKMTDSNRYPGTGWSSGEDYDRNLRFGREGREVSGWDPSENMTDHMDTDFPVDETGRSDRKGRNIIPAIVLLAAGAILLSLHFFVELPERERLLTYAAGGAVIICGVAFLAAQLLAAGREKKNHESEQETGPAYRETYAWEVSEAPAVPTGYADSVSGSSMPFHETQPQSFRLSAAPIHAETCLLGPDTGMPSALYGTGSCRGEQISLSSLPCVVGKFRDYVDQVIDDSSVSRMHARFALDREGRMTVKDLNSTNGTWLNGERLAPNETREIRQGDHLRLGRLEYVFR